MESLLHTSITFPLFSTKTPRKSFVPSSLSVAIKPPPPDFDFRKDILPDSKSLIAESYPELIDLADNGILALVKKNRYGPVPAWRKEFVEPEEIWLIGSSHISQDSAADVERVVRAVRPDNVVVELCRSRAGIMYTTSKNEPAQQQQLKSNMFSLTGTGFFGAVGRSINLGGQTALALRLLLAIFSSKISSDVNRPFGDEFRSAKKVSEEIGAQLVLGDRPIEITLERAWNSLNWSEKFNLVISVIRGITSSSDTSKNNLEESSSDDLTFQLYKQLSFSFPSLLQPLIHERDTYLAWSLKRSKAVNNCKRVVGVIGKGHMNGVIYALISDSGELRFRDLAGYKQSNENGLLENILRSLVRDTVIGVLLWGLYEQIKPSL